MCGKCALCKMNATKLDYYSSKIVVSSVPSVGYQLRVTYRYWCADTTDESVINRTDVITK